MSNRPENFDEAARELTRTLTRDSWEKMRAVAFAGAGVCTALLLLSLQISPWDKSILVAMFFATSGMPLLAASAFMVENYLSYGEESLKDLKSPSAFWLMLVVFFSGGICLLAALAVLLHRYANWLAWSFFGFCVLAFLLVVWHNMATKPGA